MKNVSNYQAIMQDVLEALRALVNAYDAHIPLSYNEDRVDHRWQVARAAIAKADNWNAGYDQ